MDWHAEIVEAGFTILPEIFACQYLDGILREINNVPRPRSRAGIRHALKLGPISDLAKHRFLMELARRVLGTQAFPFRATLFDKSRTANWLVVWHQDTALPLRSRRELPGWGPWSIKEGIEYAHAPATALSQVLALRISLDDSMAENGPLRVLPATHTLGVLSDEDAQKLPSQVSPADCICPKGGVVAMRPLLVHGSSKSKTETARRILHIEYAASDSIAHPLSLAIA
jgi:ectoine hydroxylase-related dioxygenase (phytanoyl-CoA dioxygenase family)